MSLKQYLNVYEFETELPGSKKVVRYKGLSTNAMKKLLIYENEKDPLKEEEILDHVLKISNLTENMNIDELYVMDRYFWFIKIREATKGSVFTFNFNCPKCKTKTIQSFDLKEMKVVKKDVKNNEISLINDNIKMTLDFPLRGKQKDMYTKINKNLPDKEKSVDIELANLASYVTKIETKNDGKIDIDDKELMDFIGDLPETEKSIFDNWIKDNKFGIDLNSEIKCPICEYTKIQEIPLTNFFS